MHSFCILCIKTFYLENKTRIICLPSKPSDTVFDIQNFNGIRFGYILRTSYAKLLFKDDFD